MIQLRLRSPCVYRRYRGPCRKVSSWSRSYEGRTTDLKVPILAIIRDHLLRVCSTELSRLNATAELSCIRLYFEYSCSIDLLRSAISFSSVGTGSVAVSNGMAPTPESRRISTKTSKDCFSSYRYAENGSRSDIIYTGHTGVLVVGDLLG